MERVGRPTGSSGPQDLVKNRALKTDGDTEMRESRGFTAWYGSCCSQMPEMPTARNLSGKDEKRRGGGCWRCSL